MPDSKSISILCLFLIPSILAQTNGGKNDPAQDCFWFFVDTRDANQSNHTAAQVNFLLYSGKSLGDLGDYASCNAQANVSQYVLVTYVENDTIMGYQGVCGPITCTLQNYKQMSTEMHYYLQSSDNHLRKASTSFSFPTIPPFEMDFMMGITFLLLGGFLIAAGFSTLFTRAAKPEEVTVSEHARRISDIMIDPSLGGISLIQTDSILAEKYPGKMLLKCFNIKNNLIELFSRTLPEGYKQNIEILHGIRVVAILWYTFALTAAISLYYLTPNMITEFSGSIWYVLFAGADYAAIIFLFISGFMNAFILLNNMTKSPRTHRLVWRLIFSKFVQVWPLYIVFLLFVWKILPIIGNGPLWALNVSPMSSTCSQYGWQNIFLINNIFTPDGSENCFQWGWFVALEFQLFIATIFITWLYLTKKTLARGVINLLITGSIAYSFYMNVSEGNTFSLNRNQSSQFFIDSINSNVLIRAAPYLVGISFGYLYREYTSGNLKNFYADIEDTPLTSYIIFLLGCVITNFLVFYPTDIILDSTWSKGLSEAWLVLAGPVYAIGLAMFLAPLMVGQLSWLKWMLSNQLMRVLGKVSYGIYFATFIVLEWYFNSQPNVLPFEMSNVFTVGGLTFLGCVVVGILGRVMVERPWVNVNKKLINREHYKLDAKGSTLSSPIIDEVVIEEDETKDETVSA